MVYEIYAFHKTFELYEILTEMVSDIHSSTALAFSFIIFFTLISFLQTKKYNRKALMIMVAYILYS